MLFSHRIYIYRLRAGNLYFLEHVGFLPIGISQSNNETFTLSRVFDIIKSESWELSIKHIYLYIFRRCL